MRAILTGISIVLTVISLVFTASGGEPRHELRQCEVGDGFDVGCLRREKSKFEDYVLKAKGAPGTKRKYAQALIALYTTDGNVKDADVMKEREAAYEQADDIWDELGPRNPDDNQAAASATIAMRDFFVQIGPEKYKGEIAWLNGSLKLYNGTYVSPAAIIASAVQAYGAATGAKAPSATTQAGAPQSQAAPENVNRADQQAHFARGVPECTRTQYQSGQLWVVNGCNSPVTVKFTSDSGNTWGEVDIGPNNQSMVSAIGIYDPQKDGSVYLFTCPKDSQPVLPNGSPWISNNYNGQYLCK